MRTLTTVAPCPSGCICLDAHWTDLTGFDDLYYVHEADFFDRNALCEDARSARFEMKGGHEFHSDLMELFMNSSVDDLDERLRTHGVEVNPHDVEFKEQMSDILNGRSESWGISSMRVYTDHISLLFRRKPYMPDSTSNFINLTGSFGLKFTLLGPETKAGVRPSYRVEWKDTDVVSVIERSGSTRRQMTLFETENVPAELATWCGNTFVETIEVVDI